MAANRTDLTNLLPKAYKRKLRADYFLRLATLAAFVGLLLVVAHAVLLFPTYLYGESNVRAKQDELTMLAATQTTAEEQALDQRITQLRNDIAVLGRLTTAMSGSELVRSIVAIPRPGVRLTGFTYARAEGDTAGKLMVSGTAATRDSLRAYVSALDSASFAENADIPISSYAKENDIPFTITVTLKKPS